MFFTIFCAFLFLFFVVCCGVDIKLAIKCKKNGEIWEYNAGAAVLMAICAVVMIIILLV